MGAFSWLDRGGIKYKDVKSYQDVRLHDTLKHGFLYLEETPPSVEREGTKTAPMSLCLAKMFVLVIAEGPTEILCADQGG